MGKNIMEEKKIDLLEEKPLIELPTLMIFIIVFASLIMGLSIMFFPWYISVGIFVCISLSTIIFFNLYVGLLVFFIGSFFHPTFWFPQLAVIRPARTLALLVLFVWIFHAIVYRDIKLVRAPQNIFIISFFGLVFISSFRWPDTSLPFFFEVFPKVSILYFAVSNLVKSRKELIFLIFFLIGIGFINGIIGIYQWTHHIGMMSGEGFLRVTGLAWDPNYYAAELVTILAVSVCLFFYFRYFQTKLYLGITSLIVIVGVLLSYSRGGFLQLVTLFVYIAKVKIIKNRNLATVIIFLLVFSIGFFLIPPKYSERIKTITEVKTEHSIRQRLAGWKLGMEMALTHPFTGVGWNVYRYEYFQKAIMSPDIPYKVLLVAHNTFVNLAAETGFGGLIFFLLLIWKSLKYLEVAKKKFYLKKDFLLAEISQGLKISMVIYLVGAIFLSYLEVLLTFWIIVGLSVALKELSEKVEPIGTE